MFRRNKSKGGKGKGAKGSGGGVAVDDTVALTGSGAPNSSSADASGTSRGRTTMGGRLMGRRKKKGAATAGAGSGAPADAHGTVAKSVPPSAPAKGIATSNPAANRPTTTKPPRLQPPEAASPRPPPRTAPASPVDVDAVVAEADSAEERQWQPPAFEHSPPPSQSSRPAGDPWGEGTQAQQPPPPQQRRSRSGRGGDGVRRQRSSKRAPPAPPRTSAQGGGSPPDPAGSFAAAPPPSPGPERSASGAAGSAAPAPSRAPSMPSSSRPPSSPPSGGRVRVPPPAAAAPVTRSGWSVLSNDASASVTSEGYIRSLDEMPVVRSGKAFPMLSSQPDNRIRAALSDERIRGALSRQFGRSYQPHTFHQKWFVKVSQPKWDDEEGRPKYKIQITANPTVPESGRDDAASSVADSYSQVSYISASAARSLQDFVWLEQALRAEYNGALIVPMLSLALYLGAMSEKAAAVEDDSLASASFMTEASGVGANAVPASFRYLDEKIETNETVDEMILANWLSDIINGVRGGGEVLLDNCADVVESEAMETFLYRHSETANGLGSKPGGANRLASGLGSPFSMFVGKNGCHPDKSTSMFNTFMENPFECFLGDRMCGADKKRKAQDARRKTPMGMCSSGATGLPGLEHCSSYNSQDEMDADPDFSWLQASSQGIATHSELLEAERDLVASYLKSTSLAIAKVHSLIKDEAYVGHCWKRFAIALSNLFSVEKDLEQAHIGDQIKSNKKNQPFRKLRKSVVDDALRVLARGKLERSKPSLQTIQTMLNTYYADLNSIVPAFREYSEAINKYRELDEAVSVRSNRRKNSTVNGQTENSEWRPYESLKTLTLGVITGGGTVVTNDSDPTADEEQSAALGSLSTVQTKALQERVLANEKILKFSITVLCKASPLRNARMAWWYLKTEAKQALNVHTAATTLRQKLSIDPDAAAAMKGRRYDEDEKKDNEAELELVKRILDLGSPDSNNVPDNEASRKNAIRIATEQVGRWNAKTALALMEAAGVEDAEVQIDETSRELRHVRKYAISLRENVARCLESVEALAASFIVSSVDIVQIGRSRREFWAAISAVFSGKLISEDSMGSSLGAPSTRVLASAGIEITDRGGWLGHNNSISEPNQRRNCGEAARRYLKKRDNQANILISRIIKLLKDYERRLEGIESFVYMHCVGIQLEKHCSKARSKALSAWEKRTDISTAINVATKKKIPKLVHELKSKLSFLPQVSHTTVLKRKEEHLASKTLKSDLHKLANRRFGRAQEVSTERVIAVMSLWAKHEESVAMEEVKALGEAVQEVELSIQSADVDAALDCHSSFFADRDSSAQGRSFLL